MWAAKWNPEEEWLKEISEYLDDAKMREQVAIFHDVLLSELEKKRMPKIVQEKYNMGLMNGLAGCGLIYVMELLKME